MGKVWGEVRWENCRAGVPQPGPWEFQGPLRYIRGFSRKLWISLVLPFLHFPGSSSLIHLPWLLQALLVLRCYPRMKPRHSCLGIGGSGLAEEIFAQHRRGGDTVPGPSQALGPFPRATSLPRPRIAPNCTTSPFLPKARSSADSSKIWVALLSETVYLFPASLLTSQEAQQMDTSTENPSVGRWIAGA